MSKLFFRVVGEFHCGRDQGHDGQEEEHQEHVRHRPRRPRQVHSHGLARIKGRYHCGGSRRRNSLHRHPQR